MDRRREIFNKVLDKTLEHEGGYSDGTGDYGGETYRGISRVYHPEWLGWPRIDVMKFEKPIKRNTVIAELETDVRLFYLLNFWNQICGDNIADIEFGRDNFDSTKPIMPTITYQVFDMAVNAGVRTSLKMLQRTINLLRPATVRLELVIDGIIGDITISALQETMITNTGSKTRRNQVIDIFKTFRKIHYINQAEKYETQRRWLNIWFGRVDNKRIPRHTSFSDTQNM